LVLTLCVATVLAAATHAKRAFYHQLLRQCDSLLTKTEGLLPMRIEKSKLEHQFNDIVHDSLAEVIVLSEHLDPTEIRYYSNRKLFAADQLDESENIVRRDVFDQNGLVRIQQFFRSDGKVTRKNYLNKDGTIVDSETFNLPFFGSGRGYW
jgi:hypothetical protein